MKIGIVPGRAQSGVSGGNLGPAAGNVAGRANA